MTIRRLKAVRPTARQGTGSKWLKLYGRKRSAINRRQAKRRTR